MRTFFAWVEAHPRTYFTGAVLLGLTAHWLMSGSDWSAFVDPRFPLFLR